MPRIIELQPGESMTLADGTVVKAVTSPVNESLTKLSTSGAPMASRDALDIAIDHLGGVGKLASSLGVGQSVVSNWRARGTTLDAVHCVAIEKATNGAVSRRDLRPDDWQAIWPELAQAV